MDSLPNTKRCTKCGEVKPITDFSWGKCARYRAGGRYNSHCKSCTTKALVEWTTENPDKFVTAKSNWRKNNKERLKGYSRWMRIRDKYGLTREQYEERLRQQGGKCSICGCKTDYPLFVDHNHETGEVRDLLCQVCNTVLGFVEKHSDRITKCFQYAKKHETAQNSQKPCSSTPLFATLSLLEDNENRGFETIQ